MRDTRKDKAYFEDYLNYQHSRIKKKTAKLSEADDDKKQRILVSLTGYEIDLLKAEFSIGTRKDDLKTLLNKAIKIVSEYKNIVYEDLLNLIALAIMLNEKNEVKNLIKLHQDKIKNDRLLNFLSMYIQGENAIWNEDIDLRPEFDGLNKVFVSESKVTELVNYLNTWYENHSGYSWYNSHLGSSETYCGYWSFESSAIAIILQLDESNLKDSVYYPYL